MSQHSLKNDSKLDDWDAKCINKSYQTVTDRTKSKNGLLIIEWLLILRITLYFIWISFNYNICIFYKFSLVF